MASMFLFVENAENQTLVKDNMNNVNEVKSFLEREIQIDGKENVSHIPILHNPGEIILQYCGWSINLLDNGTWYWEDTTGG